MGLGRSLYELATSLAHPFLGLVFRQRVKAGKEVPARLKERYARATHSQVSGAVIWMHGASIGETSLLIEVGKKLRERRPDLSLVMTSQTLTSAELIRSAIDASDLLKGHAVHQFAPVDTPAISKRFMDTWSPVLAVLAEGEIWPNLLKQARKRKIPTALINARMTDGSIKNWSKWPTFSHELFGNFSLVLAADLQTAEGLQNLGARDVRMVGNLKSALPPPTYDTAAAESVRKGFIGDRQCLVAVSTHAGEEEFVIQALGQMHPEPACIIIPRHPERGDDIVELVTSSGLLFSQRSRGDVPAQEHQILIADTLGEVGLFASLADTVYLGGGHAPGIGGHNPLEILRLGKPVVTGPDVFNFADLKVKLSKMTGYHLLDTPDELAAGFPFSPPLKSDLDALEAGAMAPMNETVDRLITLLPTAQTS